MKKFFFFQLFCLLAIIGKAADRTSARMLSIAKQRLAQIDEIAMTRSTRGEIKCVLERPTLSVYVNDSKFIIISRDSRFQPVLAYGFGSFSISDMPDGMKWWMSAIQESMSNYVYSSSPEPAKVTDVAPLITTKWGQWTPFNNYAPLFRDDKTKAPAGCVAIAMAQIMNFNQYPMSAAFDSYYTISDRKDTTYINVNRTYKWPYKNAYSLYYPEGDSVPVKGNYTPNQGNQVAYLCLDCACAVAMNFTPNGSGASLYKVPMALIEKFSYPINSPRYFYRDLYSEQEWMDIIYGELQKGFPFIYAGSDANGGSGHAFVADGVDDNGLVHINWGWSGFSDGYYDFRLLNPDNSEFSKGQEIVIGVRAEVLEGDKYGSMLGTDKPFELSYDNDTKKLKIKLYSIANYGGKPITGNVSVFFENLTNIEKSDTLEFLKGDTLLPFWGWSEGEEEFEWEFNPGEYKVYLASKDVHETEYQMGRAVGVGAFYYKMNVDAEKNITIGAEPIYTSIESIEFNTTSSRKNQYTNRMYDINGKMVNNNEQRKGLFIINGQKVLR